MAWGKGRDEREEKAKRRVLWAALACLAVGAVGGVVCWQHAEEGAREEAWRRGYAELLRALEGEGALEARDEDGAYHYRLYRDGGGCIVLSQRYEGGGLASILTFRDCDLDGEAEEFASHAPHETPQLRALGKETRQVARLVWRDGLKVLAEGRVEAWVAKERN